MLKEIPAAELKVGMYVVDSGLSWTDRPYLYSVEGEITSREQIEGMIARDFRTAFVDTDRGSYYKRVSKVTLDQVVQKNLDQEKDVIAKALKGRPTVMQAPQGNALELEIARAEPIYADSLKFARELFEDVRMGRQVEYEKTEPLAESIVDSVMRNQDALLSMKQLKAFDEYTFTHSINVTVLSTVFGKYLGLDRGKLVELGKSGLLHDVGKIEVPDEILNKPGKLTEAEFRQIKNHPLRGYEMIRKHEQASENVLSGILEHHEKHAGHGYPQGLSGEAIRPFGRIIAVADVYDALTSRRVYKKGLASNKALRIMYGMRGKDFYPLYVEKFIKCLGIYPVGTLVRLTSGECAVVVSSNQKQPLCPKVKVVLDSGLMPLEPYEMEMCSLTGKTMIEETLDHGELGLDPANYLMAK